MENHVRSYLLWHAFAQTPLGKRWFAGLGALLRLTGSGCLLFVVWGILGVTLTTIADAVHLSVLTLALSLTALVAAWLLLFRRHHLTGWWQRYQRRQLVRR